jgi:hypothetical protein
LVLTTPSLLPFSTPLANLSVSQSLFATQSSKLSALQHLFPQPSSFHPSPPSPPPPTMPGQSPPLRFSLSFRFLPPFLSFSKTNPFTTASNQTVPFPYLIPSTDTSPLPSLPFLPTLGLAPPFFLSLMQTFSTPFPPISKSPSFGSCHTHGISMPFLAHVPGATTIPLTTITSLPAPSFHSAFPFPLPPSLPSLTSSPTMTRCLPSWPSTLLIFDPPSSSSPFSILSGLTSFNPFMALLPQLVATYQGDGPDFSLHLVPGPIYSNLSGAPIPLAGHPPFFLRPPVPYHFLFSCRSLPLHSCPLFSPPPGQFTVFFDSSSRYCPPFSSCGFPQLLKSLIIYS